MKRRRVIIILGFLAALLISAAVFEAFKGAKNIPLEFKNMLLTSPAFKNGGRIPVKFTCEGENVNPELHIQDVPAGTKSLALVMDDPDAPAGTWTHWTVWNINSETRVIKEGEVPAGAIEGQTSFGRPGYGGPCPPPGKPHRYFFKLYALDTVLNLNAGAGVDKLQNEISGHLLAAAELMGTYQR